MRDADASRFRLDPLYTVSGQTICFTAHVVPCNKKGSPCCDAKKVDFYKLELDVVPTCNRAITKVTVNGQRVLAPTFNFYGTDDQSAIYKLTGLNLTVANAEGAQICMTLDKNGPCPNLVDLCDNVSVPGSCRYAIVLSLIHISQGIVR